MAPLPLVLETHQAIAAPPARVWEVFVGAARWPEWSEVVVDVSAAPARWEPGERLAFRLRFGAAVVGFDVRLLEVVPAERVVWSSVRWTVTGTRTHTFTATREGTEVVDQKSFEHVFVPLRLVYPRATIRRMSAAWLHDLAMEVERRETRPESGDTR